MAPTCPAQLTPRTQNRAHICDPAAALGRPPATRAHTLPATALPSPSSPHSRTAQTPPRPMAPTVHSTQMRTPILIQKTPEAPACLPAPSLHLGLSILLPLPLSRPQGHCSQGALGWKLTHTAPPSTVYPRLCPQPLELSSEVTSLRLPLTPSSRSTALSGPLPPYVLLRGPPSSGESG